ncbi:MAG: hypothetical protein IJH44_09225 [Solobacterium sp.]|nr:hypothetical protein [Solobacterium sp.]MBR0214093.1 hypothetical protein [Solobacterium sp.]
MQYFGLIFGIFGLMAYMQVFELKKRVQAMEREMSKMKGTSFHDDRRALLQAARGLIGRKVEIEMKEDHMDADIISYGNTCYGANTILDADDDWLLIHIDSPKESKDKLIRLESVKRIGLGQEKKQ